MAHYTCETPITHLKSNKNYFCKYSTSGWSDFYGTYEMVGIYTDKGKCMGEFPLFDDVSEGMFYTNKHRDLTPLFGNQIENIRKEIFEWKLES